MRGRRARGTASVVTTGAGSDHFVMVHRGNRHPHDRVVTQGTLIRCVYMTARLAPYLHIVVATDTRTVHL